MVYLGPRPHRGLVARPTIRCCGTACELPAFLDVRGLLSFWVLWELRLGPLLGVQVAERLTWRRGSPLSPGTLYPALAALEAVRLVTKRRSGRTTSYRLTPRGAAELDCARRLLRTMFQDVVTSAVGPRLPVTA